MVGREQETAEETLRSEKKEKQEVLHHRVEIFLQLMEETMLGQICFLKEPTLEQVKGVRRKNREKLPSSEYSPLPTHNHPSCAMQGNG